MAATSANNAQFQQYGIPIAIPTYDVNGNGASVANGATPFHLVSAGSANNTNIKPSNASIYGYSISNTTASTTEFVKFFNKATTPAAGTDIPIWSVQVPGASTVTAYFSVPISCSAGLGLATVTGAADNNSSAVSAGDLVINVVYL